MLADSEADAEKMENHANRPEIQHAFARGTGQSVRRSATLGRELVYRALRYDRAGSDPIVIRLALPLSQIDLSLVELRQRLLVATLVVLLIGGLVSFAFARMFAARVERLKRFSQRIAEGDFRPLLSEGPRDELSDLADSLNQTAARMDRDIRLLSGERNRSSAILRSMVEGVAVIDAQERIVFCNRAFSEILNLDSAAAEGRPLIEVVRNSDLLGLIRRALRGDEGLQSDIAMGITQKRSFSVTATPVKALDAPASGRARRQNLPAPSSCCTTSPNCAASSASARISSPTFPTNSKRRSPPSRDLPKRCLQALWTIRENNRRFLEIIRDHAMRLARLTDDLLKLARIEAGKLEVEFSSVSLLELIEALRRNHSAQGQPQGNHSGNHSPAATSRRAWRRQPAARRAAKSSGQRHPIHARARPISVSATPTRAKPSSPSPTPASASRSPIRSASSSASIASTPRAPAKPAAPASAFPSPSTSWKPTAADSGLKAQSAKAPNFPSPSRSTPSRYSEIHSHTPHINFRGAACESRYSAIHPGIPRCGAAPQLATRSPETVPQVAASLQRPPSA